jgi:hypothetical protein
MILCVIHVQGPLVFSPGLEPETFCVLDRCENHFKQKMVPIINYHLKGITGLPLSKPVLSLTIHSIAKLHKM